MSCRNSLPLLQTSLFQIPLHSLTTNQRAQLSYDKAKALGLAYNITIDDLVELRPNFWNLFTDPVAALDAAMISLLAIHYNLCAGTIVEHLPARPDLLPLLEDLLHFRKFGQFMLSEVGHGLDAARLETIATMLPSGDFDLHTPSAQAMKFMPPTLPVGTPCIAVVFARLIVDGEDRGVRAFVVALNDGEEMCQNVTARPLPWRGNPNPMNHALTSFRHVRLPHSALLGSLEKVSGPRLSPLHSTWWRIAVGSMAVGCLGLPAMEYCATLGATYSMRRTVGKGIAIFQFRTQQIPILTVTAQVYVARAFRTWATREFSVKDKDKNVLHGLAVTYKSVMVQHARRGSLAIGSRCGAQGLFAHNMFTTLYDELRGLETAEGDIFVLSIRLAIDLLKGLYALPPPSNPSSPLARHEAGLMEEARSIVLNATRSKSDGNRLLLARCFPLIESIGHRMAYEAAVAAKVMPSLLDLYVSSVMKLDPAWYSENLGLPRAAQELMEAKAADEVLPHLTSLIRDMDVLPYVSAPIASDEHWRAFVDTLPVYAGHGEVDMHGAEGPVRASL
ncbi:hypothetical protein CERSUDRAFT_156666 [Gelatoporia subvermispora B]|uniref:Acyl-CoA oxidase C-alpha1 domain-containing protein n=1 Tax=Ceriporiopsis subvermispora (strain B) TaxID=914234 RepID=M2QFX6_CERS8|nr:hypothetical protein CERSUDRAFT_156666 [Gelatoporia subvermispora B]